MQLVDKIQLIFLHSASEGGHFRQVSIVSEMIIFSLDDYFKLFC